MAHPSNDNDNHNNGIVLIPMVDDGPTEDLNKVLRQTMRWSKQCLINNHELGGISGRSFFVLLFLYARRSTQAILRKSMMDRGLVSYTRLTLLSDDTIKKVAAASFGAVRYLIHAGTSWTPRLERITGFSLDDLTIIIRWMLLYFTPTAFRDWETRPKPGTIDAALNRLLGTTGTDKKTIQK